MNIRLNSSTSYYLIIFTIGLLPFIMVLGNSLFIPLIPQIQSDLEITAVESGLILTMFTVPAALMYPVMGFLSDRYGRKRLIVISLYVIILGSIVTIIAPMFTNKWTLLLIGRVIQGIGTGGTTPLAMALVGDLFQGKERSEALGILEVFSGVGKVVSPIIGAMFTFAFLIWTHSLYFFLFVVLLSLLCIKIVIKEKKVIKSRFILKDYVNKLYNVFIMQYKWIVPIFFASGIGLFILFGMLFFLSFEFEVVYDVVGFKKGIFLAAPLCGLTVFSYITGKMVGVDVNRIKRFLFFGLLISFAAFTCLIFFHQLSGLMTYTTIAACGLGMFLPAANTAVTSSVESAERGLILSLYNMVRTIGVALGPVVYGVWMLNITEMFFMTILFLGIGIVILISTWSCIPLFKDCRL